MAVRLAAALALAGLASACQPPPPHELLDRHELRSQARSIASTAAEAAMFSDEVARHSVTATFAWVHQQALAEEAAKANEALARPVSPELRDVKERAQQVAAQLQEKVNLVAQAVDEQQQLVALNAQFEALAKEAKQLGDSL
jgi:hypothetical protein